MKQGQKCHDFPPTGFVILMGDPCFLQIQIIDALALFHLFLWRLRSCSCSTSEQAARFFSVIMVMCGGLGVHQGSAGAAGDEKLSC